MTTSVLVSHANFTTTLPVLTAVLTYLFMNGTLGMSILNCLLRTKLFCLAASTSLYVTGLIINKSSVDKKGSSSAA